jgi:hypothetical protein
MNALAVASIGCIMAVAVVTAPAVKALRREKEEQ